MCVRVALAAVTSQPDVSWCNAVVVPLVTAVRRRVLAVGGVLGPWLCVVALPSSRSLAPSQQVEEETVKRSEYLLPTRPSRTGHAQLFHTASLGKTWSCGSTLMQGSLGNVVGLGERIPASWLCWGGPRESFPAAPEGGVAVSCPRSSPRMSCLNIGWMHLPLQRLRQHL